MFCTTMIDKGGIWNPVRNSNRVYSVKPLTFPCTQSIHFSCNTWTLRLTKPNTFELTTLCIYIILSQLWTK